MKYYIGNFNAAHLVLIVVNDETFMSKEHMLVITVSIRKSLTNKTFTKELAVPLEFNTDQNEL